MQQVLEAPEVQDEERRSVTVLRSVMSALTKPGHQHTPEYAATTDPHQEAAFDHVFQTDPYLVALSC